MCRRGAAPACLAACVAPSSPSGGRLCPAGLPHSWTLPHRDCPQRLETPQRIRPSSPMSRSPSLRAVPSSAAQPVSGNGCRCGLRPGAACGFSVAVRNRTCPASRTKSLAMMARRTARAGSDAAAALRPRAACALCPNLRKVLRRRCCSQAKATHVISACRCSPVRERPSKWPRPSSCLSCWCACSHIQRALMAAVSWRSGVSGGRLPR